MRVELSRDVNRDGHPWGGFAIRFVSESAADLAQGERAMVGALGNQHDPEHALARFVVDMVERRAFKLSVQL